MSKKKSKASASNDAIKSNVLKVVSMEEKAKEGRTIGEKIAEYVAAFCGSMTFVYVHIIWFAGWIIANSLTGFAFDPFPFTFLTLVVSLEAIFLSTFILITQNHETQITERRNHLDLQIDMLAEQESTKTLELVQMIAKKVGIKDGDPRIHVLLEPMEPEQLLEQIAAVSDNKI